MTRRRKFIPLQTRLQAAHATSVLAHLGPFQADHELDQAVAAAGDAERWRQRVLAQADAPSAGWTGDHATFVLLLAAVADCRPCAHLRAEILPAEADLRSKSLDCTRCVGQRKRPIDPDHCDLCGRLVEDEGDWLTIMATVGTIVVWGAVCADCERALHPE